MTNARTTHRLLIPLLVVCAGLWSKPAPCIAPAVADASDERPCCVGEVRNDCCGWACCRVQAPQPVRLPAPREDSAPSARFAKTCSVDLFHVPNADAVEQLRQARFHTVPASGSPSLVTQQVRLQI